MRIKYLPLLHLFVPVALFSIWPTGCKCFLETFSRQAHLVVNNNNNNNNHYRCGSDVFELRAVEELEEPEEAISDAEALLACWSYLRKRKRLGNWTQFERRQAMKAAAEPQFFLPPEDLEAENSNELTEDEEADEMELEESRQINGDDMDEIWYGEFTSFPTQPSATRLRRVNASQRTWADPEFRKRWHEKRWGSKASASKPEKTQKVLRNRVRALPAGFLSSPELASMTEEEIDHAISAYTQSRALQPITRAATLAERKKKINEKPSGERLARDSLFSVDQEALKEAQRKRSEISKKAYKTRLERINKKPKKKEAVVQNKAKKSFLPSSDSPQDAIFRIEADLSRDAHPDSKDVKLIMKPQKLRKRKVLLQKILTERFDLRGKCVPVDFDDPKSETEFVTKVSIFRLGDFVIHLLENSKS